MEVVDLSAATLAGKRSAYTNALHSHGMQRMFAHTS